jgi:hypothetical protein
MIQAGGRFWRGWRFCRSAIEQNIAAMGAKFPDFPVEPGIFSIFPARALFGRENAPVNQALISQFP